MNVRSEQCQRVLVGHPGTQHSYQAVLAFQERGLLDRYVTSFYYNPTGPLGACVRSLPVALGKRIERQLLRRHQSGLDPSLICTFPLPELLYVATQTWLELRRLGPKLIQWRNALFDQAVGRLVKKRRPGIVLCYDTCSSESFKAAREVRAKAVLDQTIGHLGSGLALLREEAQQHPEFADSLHLEIPDCLLEQCRREVHAADMILAGSDYVKQTLVTEGVAPAKVRIVPYGVDLTRFRPTVKHDASQFRILFAGAIGQRKGIKYLLEAMRNLQLKNCELVLVGGIVGSGLGLTPYRDVFRHVPNVPRDAVAEWFRSADIFVYPSLHEGSALATYEALASGLPVVTTPNAGSVVRDGVEGFVVPIRDVGALESGILRLYRDRELRGYMASAARQRAEQFGWDVYRRNLANAVQELAAE